MENLNKEFEYIICFIRESDLSEGIVRQQLRALWTAFCLHWGIDCDTAMWDRYMSALISEIKKLPEDRKASGSLASPKQADLYLGTFLS